MHIVRACASPVLFACALHRPTLFGVCTSADPPQQQPPPIVSQVLIIPLSANIFAPSGVYAYFSPVVAHPAELSGPVSCHTHTICNEQSSSVVIHSLTYAYVGPRGSTSPVCRHVGPMQLYSNQNTHTNGWIVCGGSYV
jgi:hypothetical protein